MMSLKSKNELVEAVRPRYLKANKFEKHVLERKDISLPAKAQLMNWYLQLNPAELRRRIDQKTAKLWKISQQHSILMQRYHQSNIYS